MSLDEPEKGVNNLERRLKHASLDLAVGLRLQQLASCFASSNDEGRSLLNPVWRLPARGAADIRDDLSVVRPERVADLTGRPQYSVPKG